MLPLFLKAAALSPFYSNLLRRNQRVRILGLPYKYTNKVDAHDRLFKKAFFADMPILHIIPGKLYKVDPVVAGFKRLANKLPIPQYDQRRLQFQSEIADYISYLTALCKAVFIRIFGTQYDTDFMDTYITNLIRNGMDVSEDTDDENVLSAILKKIGEAVGLVDPPKEPEDDILNEQILKDKTLSRSSSSNDSNRQELENKIKDSLAANNDTVNKSSASTGASDYTNTATSGGMDSTRKDFGDNIANMITDYDNEIAKAEKLKQQTRDKKLTDYFSDTASYLKDSVKSAINGLTGDESNDEELQDLYTYSMMMKKMDAMKSRGFSFYMEASSSVNESLSSSYGASSFEDEAKTKAQERRESMRKIDIGGTIASIKSGLGTFVGNVYERTLGNLSSEDTASIISGFDVFYPEVWKSSEFSKMYNISFRFVAVYGDPFTIFASVYYPFLALLALALPRQSDSNVHAYGSPFVLSLQCPGYFVSDMGVITDISFNKGGGNKMFNVNGLPLEMEVTVSFKDLTPILAMSSSVKQINRNGGMAAYLANMAGLNIDGNGGRETWGMSLKRTTWGLKQLTDTQWWLDSLTNLMDTIGSYISGN